MLPEHMRPSFFSAPAMHRRSRPHPFTGLQGLGKMSQIRISLYRKPGIFTLPISCLSRLTSVHRSDTALRQRKKRGQVLNYHFSCDGVVDRIHLVVSAHCQIELSLHDRKQDHKGQREKLMIQDLPPTDAWAIVVPFMAGLIEELDHGNFKATVFHSGLFRRDAYYKC